MEERKWKMEDGRWKMEDRDVEKNLPLFPRFIASLHAFILKLF